MPTTQSVEDFEGDSWGACSTFIKSIRTAAFSEGKIRDGAWMADLASTHFSNKALAWYSQLPTDIQEDWPKLQAALVGRWSSQSNNDDPPTLRALRSDNPSTTGSKAPLRGILKLIMEGSDAICFVESPLSRPVCQLTADAGRAMNVRCEPVSETIFLEWSDGPRFSWLGVHWTEAQPTIGYGSTHVARLSIFYFEQVKSSWGSSGPFQISLCNVSPKGEITLVWKKGETRIPLTPFVVPPNIFITADPEAYAKINNQAKQAKLIIQRTD